MTASSPSSARLGTTLRAALVYFTRIPAGSGLTSADFARAPAHLPWVGALVGGLSAWPSWVGGHLPPERAALFSLLSAVLLTGALHEDGLADSADALLGATERARIFVILKDSRLGTYGVTALCMNYGAKWLFLSSLFSGQAAPRILVLLSLVHALARWACLPLMWRLPYVSAEGAKSRELTRGDSLLNLGLGSLWLLSFSALGLKLGLSVSSLMIMICLTVVISSLCAAWYKKRAGGYTGDFLGATEQLVELGLLGSATWLTWT